MSCYFRHMEEVFSLVGIEVTKDNKKDIDRAIHYIVDVDYKNCPDAWKKVKEIIKGSDEGRKAELVRRIKEEAGV
jgi:hypothetical protein